MTRSIHSPLGLTLLLFLGASGTLLGAWWFEHVMGHVPCKLCLLERWPYYFGIPTAALCLLAVRRDATGLAKTLLLLFALIFVISAALGAYHTGVEYGWFEGPADCGGGASLALDAGNLLGAMENTRLVACNEAGWHFLGLSFAGWNTVVSVGLVVLSLLTIQRLRGAKV